MTPASPSRGEAPASSTDPSSVSRPLRDWPRLEHGLWLLALGAPHSKGLANAAFAACALLFARDWALGRARPKATPLDRAIGVWVLVNVLSIMTSIDPVESVRDSRSLAFWAICYLVAWGIGAGASIARVQTIWLASGVAAALRGLVQSASGIDFLRPWHAGDRDLFSGHLAFGHSMAVFLALALARLGEARDDAERRALFAGTIVLALALVVSGGRGPWLAFVAIGIAWVLIGRQRRAVPILLLLVAVHVVWVTARPGGLPAYYRSYLAVERGGAAGVEDEELSSNLWRLTMWREGLRTFVYRPVSGTGVETTGELSREFRTRFEDFGVAHLHSNYFEILMTRGFVGLAGFFFLLVESLGVLWPAFRPARSGVERAALFAAVAATLAHAMHGLTHFTLGSPDIQVGFYLALGLGIAAATAREAQCARPLAGDAFAWGAATMAALFLLEDLRSGAWQVVWLACAGAALLDAAARRAPVGPLRGSLILAFAFVAGATGLLVAPLPEGGEMTRRILVAASLVFSVAYGAARLAEWLRRPGAGW